LPAGANAKGDNKMSKEILHYEVGYTYGGITKGLRFDVERDSSHNVDMDIKAGLEKATGIPANKINVGMLKCKKI
jgi:hypothetical protein